MHNFGVDLRPLCGQLAATSSNTTSSQVRSNNFYNDCLCDKNCLSDDYYHCPDNYYLSDSYYLSDNHHNPDNDHLSDNYYISNLSDARPSTDGSD